MERRFSLPKDILKYISKAKERVMCREESENGVNAAEYKDNRDLMLLRTTHSYIISNTIEKRGSSKELCKPHNCSGVEEII